MLAQAQLIPPLPIRLRRLVARLGPRRRPTYRVRDEVRLHPHVAGGSRALSPHAARVLALGPIAYWPLHEAGGVTAACQVDSPAQDGAYNGVTLGQTGIGDGLTCPLFDGTNDYARVHTSPFVAAFDGAEGSLHIWAKVSGAGVWSDGTNRRVINLMVDNSNWVYINKNSGAGLLTWSRKGSGTDNLTGKASVSETGWIALGMSWSETADEVRCYFGGFQEGTTKTGLGAWSGSIPSNLANVGSKNTVPQVLWDGYLAHAAIFDTVLSDADFLSLASV